MTAPIWQGLDLDALAAKGMHLATSEALIAWPALLAYAIEAREMLRELEWSGEEITNYGVTSEPKCPECGSLKAHGHDGAWCRLAALLGEQEDKTDEE